MQFNDILNRRDSDSIKWNFYPQDVLPLWVADMDFRSPDCVVRALQERVAHGVFGYGCEQKKLKDAVIAWSAKHYDWQLHPDEIIFLSGVVPGLHLVAQSLAQPGQALIFFPPIYPPFFKISNFAHLQEHQLPLVQDAQGYNTIDFAALENSEFPHAAILYLCNPHNPVGRVFRPDELQRLADICKERDWIICSDEIHCDLIFPGNQHTPIASLDEEIAQRTVTLFAPSKTFNIAGLKCSLLVVKNKDLKNQIKKVMNGLMNTPDVLASTAAQAAYQAGGPWLEELLQYLAVNRDFCYDFLRSEMPEFRMVKPEGTYLAWIDCSRAALAQESADFFLEKAKVGLNRGADFGPQSADFVRLNFGCPRSILEQALERMRTALNSR